MRTFFLGLAVLAGIFVGKSLHKERLYNFKPLQVPLLENEFIGTEDADEIPFLIILHLKEDRTGLRRIYQSIENQKYSSYKVLILDEKEPSFATKEFLERAKVDTTYFSGTRDRLIKEAKEIINTLPSNSMVTLLDDQHWFPNDFVLKVINLKHLSTHFELLFGQYNHYPSFDQGILKKSVKNSIRKCKFPKDPTLFSSFKVVSSKLALQMDDLLSQNDEKTLQKIFNLAGKKVCFSPHVLCTQNDLTQKEKILFDQWMNE